MAKPVKQAAPAVGDKIKCPYCGLPGITLKIFDDYIDVEHVTGKRTFVSKVTGKPFEVDAFLDGCSKHGKIGSNHHFNPSPDSDVIYEEPF